LEHAVEQAQRKCLPTEHLLITLAQQEFSFRKPRGIPSGLRRQKQVYDGFPLVYPAN
jgi:hypothetical protein